MSRSEEDVKKFVAAICYRLGIKEESNELYEIWSNLKNSNDYEQQARKISQDLARRCERAFAYLLGLHDSRTSEDGDTFAKLWLSSLEVILERKKYLSIKEKENIERIVSEVIHDVLKQKIIELPPVENDRPSGKNDTDKILEKLRRENANQSANESNLNSETTQSINQGIAELGKSVPEVVASSALLAGGILDEQMCNEYHNMKQEEKLQLWLDSYYKKGSFDDRTLVVLYREEG